MRLHPPGALYSHVYAVGAGHQGGTLRVSTSDLPVLWFGTSASWTSLGSGPSDVLGIWGPVQVGDYGGHAALWLGTPASRVDLEPPGGTFSKAHAVRANMQAGIIDFDFSSGHDHACFWWGTPGSFVDLHPSGAAQSLAFATDGVFQGGTVRWEFAGTAHAALWSGTPQSLVDLSPGGQYSEVYGMAPGIQVGYVYTNGSFHAAVWRGTAQSFVDFNGPEQGSRFNATTGRIHVGDGAGPGVGAEHALLNFGRPDAWLDLHQFLPPGYTSFSSASAVYQDGPTLYVGGYATNPVPGADEAFLWIGPDPCYPNCDQSTTPPALNVLDFVCFLNNFAAGEGYANCDQSTTPPVLNILDFVCFLNRFAAGCS